MSLGTSSFELVISASLIAGKNLMMWSVSAVNFHLFFLNRSASLSVFNKDGAVALPRESSSFIQIYNIQCFVHFYKY